MYNVAKDCGGSTELRPTVRALCLAKSVGFQPNTIIDVGAYSGEWARLAHSIWPDASISMYDGNPENEEKLQTAVRQLPRADYRMSLLGPEHKPSVKMYQMSTGSSVLPELTSFPRNVIEVEMNRLDDLAHADWQSPVLLKLDVQGFELEVLKGARQTLARTEMVVLEAELLPYNEGAASFLEIANFLHDAGFSLWDIGDDMRRQSDQVLFQIDALFVRKDSSLRAKNRFFLHEP